MRRRVDVVQALIARVQSLEQRITDLHSQRDESVNPSVGRSGIPAIIQVGGRYVLNPAKDDVRPFFLMSDVTGEGNDAGDVVLAANGTEERPFTPRPEDGLRGDMLITGISDTHDGQYQLRWRHHGIQKEYQNRLIESTLMVGTNNFRGIPWRPIFVPAGIPLNVEFRDLSAAPNTVRLVFSGHRFVNFSSPENRRESLIQTYGRHETFNHSYWLTTDRWTNDAGGRGVGRVTLPAGAGSEATLRMRITGQADFEVRQFLALASQGQDSFAILIKDGVSGRPLSIRPVPAGAIMGNAAQPFIISETWLGKKLTDLDVTLRNLDAGVNIIDLAFHGRLVYYATPGHKPVKSLERPGWPVELSTRGE